MIEKSKLLKAIDQKIETIERGDFSLIHWHEFRDMIQSFKTINLKTKLNFKEKKEAFLKWFNQKKKQHTGKAGQFKVLSKQDENNLKKLLEGYTGDDFEKAIPNLYKSEWASSNDGFNPSHFLRVDNFNRYLNQESSQSPEEVPHYNADRKIDTGSING